MTTETSQTKAMIAAIQGTHSGPPPIWLMRQAGRYLPEYREIRAGAGTFLDLCYTPSLAAEVTLQPIRRYGMDAAILFSDILVIPHALGQKVEFHTGEGPVLDRIEDEKGLSKLDPERVIANLAPVFETVERVHDQLDDKTALIGFAGAPWTVATYMLEGGSSRNFINAKKWAYTQTESFDRLIDILVDATTRYLIAQIEAGAEVIQLFDSWSGVLPEFAFRRYAIDPTRRIVERLRRAHPHVPIIGFPNRSGSLYPLYARETGVDAVSIDWTVTVENARETLQPSVAVQGNLDPVLLAVGGPELEAEARRIVDGLKGGRFVFNLGHGILPITPPEHVARLVKAVRAA